MRLIAMPRPKRAQSRTWGETKGNRLQVLVTDTVHNTMELAMERTSYSRSELIERLVRGDEDVQQAIAAALADVQQHQVEQKQDDA